MKFKASLFASLFAAPLLATTVTSANTFGIVKVDSGHTATIISTTWEACGGGDIKVTDVVTTTNLSEGDELYYWDGDTLKAFRLTSGEWAVANLASSGEFVPAASGDLEATVARGTALVLVRHSASSPFYVYGQVGTTTPTFDIAVGANVLASPKAEAFAIGGSNWSSNSAYVSDGDQIQIPLEGGAKLIFIAKVDGSDGSVVWKDDRWNTANYSIPAGEGFWYVNNGNVAKTGVSW